MASSGALDTLALWGAEAAADPTGPGAYFWDSNVAWGYASPLAADYAWMYDDGPGSGNVGCPAPGAAGCWVHRLNILSPWSGAVGTATYAAYGSIRFAALLVEGF